MSRNSIREEARDIPVLGSADVVVCGGGPAGSAAALAAARTGASVILLEDQIALGGTATTGMVNRLGPYHDEQEIILGGIPWEILETLVERGMARAPRPCSPSNVDDYWVAFDPEAMKLLLDELILEAGVDVVLAARVTAPVMEDGAIRGVMVESKSGRQAVLGKVVIDCTGDGDVAARAGAPFHKGRDSDGLLQPITLMSKTVNQDHPAAWKHVLGDRQPFLKRARELGNDFVWPGMDSILRPVETYYNGVHVHKVDSTNVRHITSAAMDMRRRLWINLQVLKEMADGCANADMSVTASLLGVRESRRIEGEATLTVDDVLEGRRFDDQVFRYACYVDIHQIDPDQAQSEYADRRMEPGTSYGIPYRTLLPKAVEGLLVAGRCFSATHEALASARMMPSCMAMGQAAGTAAALCAASGVAPRDLAAADLRARLEADGVIL